MVSQDFSLTGGAWVEGCIGGRWAGSVIQAVVSLGEAERGCQRGLFPVLLAFWRGEAEPSVPRAVPSIQWALGKCLLLLVALEVT